MKYQKIIFKNGKIFVLAEQEKGYKPILQEFDDDPDEFNNLYNCDVEFSPDLTVGGFLRALQPFIKTIEYHFASFIGNYELSEYFELLNFPFEPKTNNEIESNEKIQFIEMYWSAEIFEYEDILNNKIISDYSHWGSYHGVTNDIHYSMSLTPINNWQHYIFKLNNIMICWKNDRNDSGVFMNKVFESEYNWNLHDLLKWFFYELTFFGSLSDQESFTNKLTKQVEEIEIGDGTGLIHFDLDEMEIESLEKLLIEAIETENYEGAVRIRNKIKKIKEK